MSKPLIVFIEYDVKKEAIFQYKRIMDCIFDKAIELEAKKIDWFCDQNNSYYFHEVYEVPTHSHYYGFTRFRTMKNHPVFGELQACLPYKLSRIDCYAVQNSSSSLIML